MLVGAELQERSHPMPEHHEHQTDGNESRAEEDVGSRSVDSDNGGAVHDGLAGGDPDDCGDCAEHCDEQNHRDESPRPDSRSLAR